MSFVCVQLLKKKIHEFGNSLQEDLHPKHCTKRVQYPPWAVDCICCSARIRTFSTCVEYHRRHRKIYQATTQRSRCPKKEQFAFHYLVVTFQDQWNRQHLLSRYACLEACCQWHPYLPLSYLLEEGSQN